MKTIILLSLVLLASCGKQNSGTKTYAIKKEALTTLVNNKSLPKNPNLSLDKSFVNNSYPIEIALYEDNRFYYDLPNLGDGYGTWKLDSDGIIKLKAKRTLFDMYIDVLSSDEANKNIVIQFTDRFGPNTLKMTNNNF